MSEWQNKEQEDEREREEGGNSINNEEHDHKLASAYRQNKWHVMSISNHHPKESDHDC